MSNLKSVLLNIYPTIFVFSFLMNINLNLRISRVLLDLSLFSRLSAWRCWILSFQFFKFRSFLSYQLIMMDLFASCLFLRFCIVSNVALPLAEPCRASPKDFRRTYEKFQSLSRLNEHCLSSSGDLTTSRNNLC